MALWTYTKKCLGEALPHFERGEPVMEYAPTLAFKALTLILAAAGVGFSFNAPPAWLLILPLLALLFIWAPYRVWQKTQERVDELEEQRRPRMFIVPLLEDLFLKDEPGYLLRIRNKGRDEITDCYVHLEKIIWGARTQNGQMVYRQLFSTDDIYFRWKAGGEERRYTFSDEALCTIAGRFRSGGAVDIYALSAIGVVSDNVQLTYEGPYFIVLQIGARNHDTVRRFYKLTPGRGHGDDGEWVEIEDESGVPASDE